MSGLILFEDEDLLVVHKPSGVNTHKPDRFAPDGIHEWLTKREPRWSKLSIQHRLDKDTSGVMVFGKSPRANQSLSRQFAAHEVAKEYLLLVSVRPRITTFEVKSRDATTHFEFLHELGNCFLVRARPITGKTHQVRRHAADQGIPIVGDTQYGGAAAPRLMLHAHKLGFEHPATGRPLSIEVPMPKAFEQIDPLVAAREFRELLFGVGRFCEAASGGADSESRPTTAETDAYRLVSGATDGFSDVVVDSYAGTLLVQWQTERRSEELLSELRGKTVYEQFVTKQTRTVPRPVTEGRASARPSVAGQRPRGSVALRKEISIRENGLTFLVNLGESLSTGIFLDQRENRRRLLKMNLAGRSVLNCFAYTCAFSVAAAKAGATVTSIDLSKKSLEWGRQNFRANDLNLANHDFIFGDVFDWLRRFGKRERRWDVVILDPPTFATTKSGRVFRAARDYSELARLAIAVVASGGTLFCSTNLRALSEKKFEELLREAARRRGRIIEDLQYETLPFDFRVPSGERPYLKTYWARLD